MMISTQRMLRLFALSLVLALGAACGGDSPDAATPVSDAGADAPGAHDDADPGEDDDEDEPAWDVVPGFVHVELAPPRISYAVGMTATPQATVIDAFGEEIDAELEWSVEPADAALEDGARWRFEQEGHVRFEACTVAPGPEGRPVCGSAVAIVNNGPPTLEISSPLPGEELDAASHPVIVIEGKASDSFGEPRVWVNGLAVELDEEGAFRAELTPRFGVNHIEVEASDGSHSTTTRRALDVLWAADYRTAVAEERPAIAFEDGIVLRLGQRFIDDGSRVQALPDGTLRTEDLADVLELVIRNVDFSTQIPDPIFNSSAAFLRVTDVAVGKPLIDADVVDSGLEVFIQIPEVTATTEGRIEIDEEQESLNGHLTVGLSALVAIDISKPSADAPLQVEISRLSVAIESAASYFESPEANAVFELAQSALRTTLETLLMDALEASFVDQLPVLLTDVLSSLDTALRERSFPLDLGLGDPLTLLFDARMQALSSQYRNHLSVVMSAAAAVEATPLHVDSRGVALQVSQQAPAFFDSGRIQVGLRLALVNGLLHALWNAGLLEADVTDAVPAGVDEALLSAKLPPIVRPPLLGEPYDVVLEIGQLEVETALLGQRDRFGVSLSAGLSIELVDEQVSLVVADQPQIRTWLIESSGERPVLTADALRSLLLSQVWPQLRDALAESLALPLPVPDLSGVGGVAAPLAGLMMRFETVLPVAVREGWIVLDTALVGSLPAAP